MAAFGPLSMTADAPVAETTRARTPPIVATMPVCSPVPASVTRAPPRTPEAFSPATEAMVGTKSTLAPFGSWPHVEMRARLPATVSVVSQSLPSHEYSGQLMLKGVPLSIVSGPSGLVSPPPLAWQYVSPEKTRMISLQPKSPSPAMAHAASVRQRPSHMRNCPAGHAPAAAGVATPTPGTRTRRRVVGAIRFGSDGAVHVMLLAASAVTAHVPTTIACGWRWFL